MYCSRRGREVPRSTDTCKRCGRCNWEQKKDQGKTGKCGLGPLLCVGAILLLAAAVLLIRYL